MNRSMKRRRGILFLLPELYPCIMGGIEIFHHYFVHRIAGYFDVFVCTGCDRFRGGNDVTVISYPYRTFGSHNLSAALHQTRSIWQLRKRIDLIHIPYSSRTPYNFYYVILLKHLLNIPYLLRIHGGGMHIGRPAFLHQWWVDQAAAVMTVSNPVREEYERRHGKPITVIPSMLPFKRAGDEKEILRSRFGLDEQDMVVLFVGSLKDIKGPDLLIEAFLGIDTGTMDRRRLNLVFAGDGAMRKDLEARASGSAFSGRIRFLGRVPHERVCELYAMADIFCIPSLTEARPLSLAEALFNGLPAVGSDIATIRNIISDGETGLIFRSGDADHLREKLLRLVENPESRDRIGKEALRSYKDFYDYDRMVQSYRRFYDGIIDDWQRA